MVNVPWLYQDTSLSEELHLETGTCTVLFGHFGFVPRETYSKCTCGMQTRVCRWDHLGNQKVFERISPINNISKNNALLLITHGKNDSRLTVHEAVSTYRTLSKDVHTEPVIYEMEGHSMSSSYVPLWASSINTYQRLRPRVFHSLPTRSFFTNIPPKSTISRSEKERADWSQEANIFVSKALSSKCEMMEVHDIPGTLLRLPCPVPSFVELQRAVVMTRTSVSY
jgi:hypothetical protein